MFCPNCGNQLKDNAAFCTKCGTKLNTAGKQPAQAPSASSAGEAARKTAKASQTEKQAAPRAVQKATKGAGNGKKKKSKLPLVLAILVMGALLAALFLYFLKEKTDKMPPESELSEWGNEPDISEDEEDRDEIKEEESQDEASKEEPEKEDEGEKTESFTAESESALASTKPPEEESAEAGQTAWPQASDAAGESGASFEMENVPYITMEHVSSVTATSELKESNATHSASRIMDGSLDKAWVEGSSGQGIGEGVSFRFDGQYIVSGFTINAGYQKSSDLYYKNSRPASLRVLFDDGSSSVYPLQDLYGAQNIQFDTTKQTGSISIYIESVYAGSKYEDTVISEIKLY